VTASHPDTRLIAAPPLKAPPLKKNIWHPLNSHPEIQFGQYIVPNFVSNSVCITLNKNEYILISPGEPLLAPFKKQFNNGQDFQDITIHIVIPNSFHYMGVAAWQDTFVNTRLYASQDAIPKLIEKGVAVSENDIFDLALNQPPWPQDYSVMFPPGHRGGDVWVKKQDTKNTSTWITCDSFLNYERVSNQPVARFMQKILNAAPGLKISQVIKWFILRDKKSFKTWVLEKLKQDNPTTLIPAHGEINQSEHLKSELERVVLTRL